jgi:putative aldouronate transport system permease protein
MIDGANRMQRIRYVTIPGIISTYFVLLFISIGHFLNVGMEQYLLFGNAMNMQYVEVLDLFVYHKGIDMGQISFATAIGVMKSVVSVTLFTFANILSKKVRGSSIF